MDNNLEATNTANFMNSIAKKIKKERKAQGLSQTELAHLSQVSLNFVSQLESGKQTIRMDKVVYVLNTLGLEIKLSYKKTRKD